MTNIILKSKNGYRIENPTIEGNTIYFDCVRKLEKDLMGFDDVDGYAQYLIKSTILEMFSIIENTNHSKFRKKELKKIFIEDFKFYLNEKEKE